MNSLESKNVKNQLNQFYILNFQISTINKILAVDIKCTYRKTGTDNNASKTARILSARSNQCTHNNLTNAVLTAARHRLTRARAAPRRLHNQLIRVRAQLFDSALNSWLCVVAAHFAITSLSNNRISCAVPVPPLLGSHCQGHRDTSRRSCLHCWQWNSDSPCREYYLLPAVQIRQKRRSLF